MRSFRRWTNRWKRTDWQYTNHFTGETTGIILTSSPPPQSTVPSTSSKFSSNFSVLYIMLSLTFFNVSDFPPTWSLSTQLRQIFQSPPVGECRQFKENDKDERRNILHSVCPYFRRNNIIISESRTIKAR